MSRRIRRVVVLLMLAVGVLAPVPLLAGPAAAVTPTGGCWVWYAGTPSSDISSALAPWTDNAASPAGPADYEMTLSPTDPAPGETVTISLTFDKGPKNGGPAAAVTGRFDFDVNGTTVSGTKSFGTVGGSAIIPGTTVTAQFVAEAGANDVVFEGVTFTATAFDIKIDCNGQTGGSPSGNNPKTAPLPTNITGTVTGSGDPVDPTLTPSPTESPTESASPTATASTSEPTESESSGTGAGKPAKGTADFACTLNPLGSDFDYAATMSVSGYRAAEGDPVTLKATMSDLPGIAPLPIDGSMDVTVTLDADGESVTLEASDTVQVPTKQPVPVPDLAGELASDVDEMEIGVSAFTFAFPDLDIDADCTAPSGTSLGTMKVGTEPTDDETEEGDGPTTPGVSASGGDLPKTGGPAELLPVLGLFAGALVLLGGGALVLVPGGPRRPYRRQH